MGAGRIIAIIGGVLGILSIVLFHVLPEFFCFWRLDAGAVIKIWEGGFGFVAGETGGTPIDPDYSEEIIWLIVGILVVAGGALSILGGLVENKLIGALGGLVMLAGPIIYIIFAALVIGPFEDLAALLGSVDSLLFGSQPGVSWGLWIGSFLAIGGGVLGIIGGATLD